MWLTSLCSNNNGSFKIMSKTCSVHIPIAHTNPVKYQGWYEWRSILWMFNINRKLALSESTLAHITLGISFTSVQGHFPFHKIDLNISIFSTLSMWSLIGVKDYHCSMSRFSSSLLVVRGVTNWTRVYCINNSVNTTVCDHLPYVNFIA